MRILVVEDNPVNQVVAQRMLAREGHAVVVAENGRLALNALRHARFDVVLMDVHVPEMNGHEATAALRARESGTGEHVTVIAMTANAMQGDRERCLAAGMEDHISKPVKRENLLAALERARTGGSRSPALIAPAARGDLYVGEPWLRDEAVRLVIENAPRQIGALTDALEAGDAPRARLEAHGLKGVLGYFDSPCALIAATMEDEAAAGALESASEGLPELREAIGRLISELAPVPV